MKKLSLLMVTNNLFTFCLKALLFFWSIVKVVLYIASSIFIVFGLLTSLLTGTGLNAVLQGGFLFIITVLIDIFILFVSPLLKNYFSR